MRLRTIDAHAAGEPLRLVVEGWPAPTGRTMLERRAWAAEHQDDLRRVLMFEPRGHADMYGAVLTEPERPDSDAGVLFMHNEGFSTMCGHGVIAVATIAIERGLLPRADGQRADGGAGLQARPHAGSEDPALHPDGPPKNPDGPWAGAGPVSLTLDAPAGQIRVRAEVIMRNGQKRVDRVSFANVPSFVLAAAVPIQLGTRTLQVDVAFGGAFYAIVDAEAAGVPVVVDRLPELRQAGMAIKREVERAVKVIHPTEPGLLGIYGTIFTGPATRPEAHLRNVTIFADAEVDRSPCGTGTCAVLAVLDAMGLVEEDRPFIHESIIGTTFSARVAARTTVGDREAIVPMLTGDAWITGEHTFLADKNDPLRRGFRI
jgi:proline racemase